ncbi:alginate O-acetyltransferase AlgF [Undibacterium jejuense]|uniref:Alginate O-acetyltransferase AlgF n=1 Tax=Undibacterium jejuense TaxID=1344949 RepID=A0A923HDL1_9BURK|nr:alginate O-acetyltransferase AlgF [Undibacterium jejuense]MBC3861804.1 alginate O-acetyltransferase AlgF [Undibacterium jejuense]
MKKLILTCIATMCSMAAYADNPLYETGPGQDSSFVRFLNASGDKAMVVNGSAKVNLDAKTEGRVSRFYPVKAGEKLTATVQVGAVKTSVEVTAKPGEFVTVAIVNKGAALESMLVRETPTDFNAMRASISLMNVDASCAAAGLTGGAKNAMIFEAVKPATTTRRLVNPVSLTVQANCGGEAAGAMVDMSQLQAGERYSVIVIPAKKGRQAFFVRDSTS